MVYVGVAFDADDDVVGQPGPAARFDPLGQPLLARVVAEVVPGAVAAPGERDGGVRVRRGPQDASVCVRGPKAAAADLP